MHAPVHRGPRRRLAVVAGGTGGHIFPAMALAEELECRGWRIDFFTDRRGARYLDRVSAPRDLLVMYAEFSLSRGSVLDRVKAPFALLSWTLLLRILLRHRKCVGVVAFGGYVTVPLLAAAWLRRIPRILHEQNARLGRVNRLFARRATHLVCGLARPPEATADAVVTGNPISAEFRRYGGCSYLPPEDGEMIQVLVTGGSQGSRSVATLAAEALGLLSEELRGRLSVSMQAREEDLGRVGEMLETAGVRHHVSEFYRDVPKRLADCHLVIGRAGASTLSEIAAIGRPSILIPLPSAMDDHQNANARVLAEAGGALVFPETGDGRAAALADEIEDLLRSRNRLQGMAAAARGVARPNATRALADLVEQYAGGGR